MTATNRADQGRYRENLQDEMDGATLYLALAELEVRPQLAELYRRLAATEERHAAFWENRIRASGGTVDDRRPSRRARAIRWLGRRLGPGFLLSYLAATEQTGRTMYDEQPEALGTSLPADERSHARLLRTVSGTSPGGVPGGALARLEGRHRMVGGNVLRASVLGANDGLVSNLSLVMGVAGAALSNQAILSPGWPGSSRELHRWPWGSGSR
jgi:hypothetical protein